LSFLASAEFFPQVPGPLLVLEGFSGDGLSGPEVVCASRSYAGDAGFNSFLRTADSAPRPVEMAAKEKQSHTLFFFFSETGRLPVRTSLLSFSGVGQHLSGGRFHPSATRVLFPFFSERSGVPFLRRGGFGWVGF